MEITEINTATFQILYDKVEEIRLNVLREKSDYPLKDRWLDIAETCQLLNISKRTLQAYRDNGILPFSQVAGKIYFKAEDIQKHLEQHYHKAIKK